MSVRRIVPVVVLVLMVGVVISRLGFGGESGSLQSLDSSGSSQSASPTAGATSSGAGRQQGQQAGTPTADAASVDGFDQASVQKGAFILLNPASATASSTIAVAGSGFDPASVIDFYLTDDPKNDDQPQELGFAQADSSGSFGSFGFSLPPNYRAPTFTVIARQRNSTNEAMATGRLEALRPSVKMGTNVGAVGDLVQISAQGFMPDEQVNVHFNSLSGDPFESFTASSSGTLEKVAVRIPYGPVGNNSLIFVGNESQSPVTVQFLMLTLYPNVALSSYATRADTVLAFSGSGFGPEEEVAVHLNNPRLPPIITFNTGPDGTFENSGAFLIPFELTGKNTLIFVGQKSQATATAGFDVLPYTPNVQPSTYGGRPGTTITFYGDGFARDEVVRFYVNRTQNSPGQEVSCAKATDQGTIGAGGSYMIPLNAEAGQLTFTVMGGRSRAVTTTAIEVMEAGIPIQPSDVPQVEYQCPFDDQEGGDAETLPPAPAQQAPVPPTPQRLGPQGTPSQVTPQARPTVVPTATARVGGTAVPTTGVARVTAVPTSAPSVPRVTPVPTPDPNVAPPEDIEQPASSSRPVVVSSPSGGVDMRTDPSDPDSVAASLDAGSRLEMLGESATVGNDQWVRVETSDGEEGWVPAGSIQAVPQDAAPRPPGQ